MDGLGSEAHDGECLWTAAVSTHMDEKSGGIAVGGKESLVWVLGGGSSSSELLDLRVFERCGW